LRFRMASSEEHVWDALFHLTRSLTLLIGCANQQPEGARDLLFTIAEGLKVLGEQNFETIKAIAQRCRDSGSWFYPNEFSDQADSSADS
jgi:hypothetical protein